MDNSERSGNPVTSYLKSAWEELGKVTWPTREQAIRMTVLVVLISFLVTVLIGIVDWILALGYDNLLDLLRSY